MTARPLPARSGETGIIVVDSQQPSERLYEMASDQVEAINAVCGLVGVRVSDATLTRTPSPPRRHRTISASMAG